MDTHCHLTKGSLANELNKLVIHECCRRNTTVSLQKHLILFDQLFSLFHYLVIYSVTFLIRYEIVNYFLSCSLSRRTSREPQDPLLLTLICRTSPFVRIVSIVIIMHLLIVSLVHIFTTSSLMITTAMVIIACIRVSLSLLCT